MRCVGHWLFLDKRKVKKKKKSTICQIVTGKCSAQTNGQVAQDFAQFVRKPIGENWRILSVKSMKPAHDYARSYIPEPGGGAFGADVTPRRGCTRGPARDSRRYFLFRGGMVAGVGVMPLSCAAGVSPRGRVSAAFSRKYRQIPKPDGPHAGVGLRRRAGLRGPYRRI